MVPFFGEEEDFLNRRDYPPPYSLPPSEMGVPPSLCFPPPWIYKQPLLPNAFSQPVPSRDESRSPPPSFVAKTPPPPPSKRLAPLSGILWPRKIFDPLTLPFFHLPLISAKRLLLNLSGIARDTPSKGKTCCGYYPSFFRAKTLTVCPDSWHSYNFFFFLPPPPREVFLSFQHAKCALRFGD